MANVTRTKLVEYKAAHNIFLNESMLGGNGTFYKLPHAKKVFDTGIFTKREFADISEAYNKFRHMEHTLFEGKNSRDDNWREFLKLEDARIEEGIGSFLGKAVRGIGSAAKAAKKFALGIGGSGDYEGQINKFLDDQGYEDASPERRAEIEDDVKSLIKSKYFQKGYLQRLGDKLGQAYDVVGGKGRLTRGGKMGGKEEYRKAGEAQMGQVLEDPADQEKLVKKLSDALDKDHPKFPNQEDNFDFYTSLGKIWKAYETIANQPEGKLDVDTKNKLIANLRVYVQDLMGRRLSDRFRQSGAFGRQVGKAPENVKSESRYARRILEAEDTEDTEKSAAGPYSGKTGKTVDTKEMESKTLPRVLKILGTILGAAGGIFKTSFGKDWMKEHMSEIIKVTDPGNPPQDLLQSFTDKVVKVDMAGEGKGQGAQWMVQRYLGLSDAQAAAIQAKTPAKEVYSQLLKSTGAENPDELFNRFAEVTYPGIKQSKQSAAELKNWFAKMAKFDGDWGQYWAQDKFPLIFAKAIFVPVVKTVAIHVAGRAATTMALSAGLGAAGLTLGALAGPIGWAGLAITAGGMGIQWLRDKDSREKMLQALLDRMVDAKPGQEKETQKTPPEPGPSPAPGPTPKPTPGPGPMPPEETGGGEGGGGERGQKSKKTGEGLFPADDTGMIKLSDIKDFARLKKISPRLTDAVARALDAKGMLRNVNLNEAFKPRAKDVDEAIEAIADNDTVKGVLADRLGKEPGEVALEDMIDDKPLRQVVAMLVKGGVVGQKSTNESAASVGNVMSERWQRLAGIL